MILWPCFSCGSCEYCSHREPELVAWAIEQQTAAGAIGTTIADPLPARKPAAIAREAAAA